MYIILDVFLFKGKTLTKYHKVFLVGYSPLILFVATTNNTAFLTPLKNSVLGLGLDGRYVSITANVRLYLNKFVNYDLYYSTSLRFTNNKIGTFFYLMYL